MELIAWPTHAVAKQRVSLVEKGVCVDVVYDAQTAAKEGRSSTGHGLPAPNSYGPFALNQFMAPGSASREELIGGLDRGLHGRRVGDVAGQDFAVVGADSEPVEEAVAAQGQRLVADFLVEADGVLDARVREPLPGRAQEAGLDHIISIHRRDQLVRQVVDARRPVSQRVDGPAHAVPRGRGDEVLEHWSFEVWNEANLEVFWSGTPEEYMKMYDVSAAAVRAVDPRLKVGGPSSAAAGWVEELLAHVEQSGAPLDFVSTHTYGSPPLDFRGSLERYGRAGTPIWWTEWGVTPTHFNEVSDAVFSGVFLLRGMASAMDRIEALSYWVVSDHFEELGRPPALLHGGFGLRTVGELRKPRWWALRLLEELGRTMQEAASPEQAQLPVVSASVALLSGGDANPLERPGLVEHISTVVAERSASVMIQNFLPPAE